MHDHLKLFVAITACSLASMAAAQTTGRTAEEAARDTGNAAGRAASAAVTPGDQNMGRTPDNRSGGMMGNGGNASGTATSSGGRAPRADRG